jgi:hypothetical protein
VNNGKTTLLAIAAVAAFAGGCNSKAKTTDDTRRAAPNAPLGAKDRAAKATADAPFEGQIQVAVYDHGSAAPKKIAYAIKGDHVRAEWLDGMGDTRSAHVVASRSDKVAVAVTDSTKSYANIDVESVWSPPPVTKSGKVERVAGRECEDWSITDGDQRVDVCVAKNIAFINATAAGEPTWASVLSQEHVFPLRVVATDQAGKQVFRAEATKIDVKHVDDATFKVPADYRADTLTRSTAIAAIPADIPMTLADVHLQR